MTHIVHVSSRRDLRRFIDYPYQKYKDDPHWVPPLRMSEAERLNPKKNPFFEHAHIDLFLAERGGEVVGRIAAIDDDLHNQTHGDNVAFFGFFEAADEAVARALLERVETWAQERGRAALRGPMNPSMNETFGLQVDAFDQPPYTMMPYNPPEYLAYLEGAGYTKVKDVYAWLFESGKGMGERLARLAARVEKRYQPDIRSLDMKRLDDEVTLLKDLYDRTWEQNWGFVKYTDAEIRHLISELKPIADPNLILFIYVGGEVAGMTISLPNVNQVFARMNGRLFPFGFIQLLRRKQIIDQARVWALGLVPEYRYKGLELVLINELYQRNHQTYRNTELSWVLEDNDAMNRGIEAAGATRSKTYRLLQKSL